MDQEPQVTEQELDVTSTVDSLADSLRLSDTPLEKEPTSAEPAPDKPVGTEGAAEPLDKPAAPATPTEDRVPDTWRKEAQALWANVDPGVKAEIAKREADIAKYVSDTQASVQIHQNLEKVLGPYAQAFQQYKVNPWTHIQGLMAAHYNLVFGAPERKVAMLQQICRDIGITPQQLVDPNYKPAEPQPWERGQHELGNRFANLERQVTGVTGALQEQRVAELSQGILAFAEDAEAHPFFWDVAEDIRQLIDKGAAGSLEEAYNMAILRNPETKAKRLDLDRAADDAKRKAANATKVAAARKATGANVISRGQGRMPEPNETLEETLRSTMKSIREREKS